MLRVTTKALIPLVGVRLSVSINVTFTLSLQPMKYPKSTPSNSLKRQWLISISALVSTVFSDQYTKSIAQNYLANQEFISTGKGVIVFSYVENSAGFLGILKGLPHYMQFFLLNICVALLLLYCLYYLFSSNNHTILRTFSLATITGGGMSNLIDRIMHDGYVIDFLQLRIGSIKTGIFNLADIYILAGSFLLGFVILAADP